MRFTVLSVAYPLVPVSSDTAGGAEQIVSLLDRHIVASGGRSIVMAAEGSRVRGVLIPTPKWDGPIDTQVREWAAREHRRILNQALQGIDIVHFHGLDFREYLPEADIPCVATLHLPTGWYPQEIFTMRRERMVYVCVSSSQQGGCQPSTVPIRTIQQGIDVDSFAMPPRKRWYALALGRICPEKGFHFAIGAAQRAGAPLVIAGQVFPYQAHQQYFQHEIAPRLRRCVRFVGPVGLGQKRRLLSRAKCVLIPSTVAETSSLVAMEALASGTPVIAFGSGALPEIVEHGRTGFIVHDEAEMAEAIHRTGEIDSEDCRAAARERFSAARMAREYFDLYEQVKFRVGEVVENCTSRPAA